VREDFSGSGMGVSTGQWIFIESLVTLLWRGVGLDDAGAGLLCRPGKMLERPL